MYQNLNYANILFVCTWHWAEHWYTVSLFLDWFGVEEKASEKKREYSWKWENAALKKGKGKSPQGTECLSMIADGLMKNQQKKSSGWQWAEWVKGENIVRERVRQFFEAQSENSWKHGQTEYSRWIIQHHTAHGSLCCTPLLMQIQTSLIWKTKKKSKLFSKLSKRKSVNKVAPLVQQQLKEAKKVWRKLLCFLTARSKQFLVRQFMQTTFLSSFLPFLPFPSFVTLNIWIHLILMNFFLCFIFVLLRKTKISRDYFFFCLTLSLSLIVSIFLLPPFFMNWFFRFFAIVVSCMIIKDANSKIKWMKMF